MLFSDAVHLHRERCNLTQAELARRLGVRQQTVSRWEAGLALPSPKRVLVLEDELGLARGSLLRVIGYLPESQSSGQPDLVRRIVQELPSLSDGELMLIIDAAWQLHRERHGMHVERAGEDTDTSERAGP